MAADPEEPLADEISGYVCAPSAFIASRGFGRRGCGIDESKFDLDLLDLIALVELPQAGAQQPRRGVRPKLENSTAC